MNWFLRFFGFPCKHEWREKYALYQNGKHVAYGKECWHCTHVEYEKVNEND